METIGLLKNTIQEYAWGSASAIADLLGLKNHGNKPQAELWMGAHWKAPSLVQHNGNWVSLQDLIKKNPKAILGENIAENFNDQLPYLFKVLAAAKPLSIQAHPDLQQARKGFKRENARKIPLDASNRNYLDDNHKPECICALTQFWILSRFRKIPAILLYLEKLNLRQLRAEFTEFGQQPNSDGLKRFYTALMSRTPGRQKEVIDEALRRTRRFAEGDPVFNWVLKLADDYPNDIGVLSPIFLNLICLEPGQAIYLDAGELHAYLHGLGVELMANSDNVLRGGLTSKHVDVPELLRILKFEGNDIKLLAPRESIANEFVYSCPAKEFVLSVITLKTGALYQSPADRSVEILICTGGTLTITDLGNQIETQLPQGASAVVPAAVKRYAIRGQGICYKAAVPL
ncbi:MAG: mannose-6-phosphate isomerase, class I [Desulfobacterales bacterium]|jgi:mannose-6-phosphate isomerase